MRRRQVAEVVALLKMIQMMSPEAQDLFRRLCEVTASQGTDAGRRLLEQEMENARREDIQYDCK